MHGWCVGGLFTLAEKAGQITRRMAYPYRSTDSRCTKCRTQFVAWKDLISANLTSEPSSRGMSLVIDFGAVYVLYRLQHTQTPQAVPT